MKIAEIAKYQEYECNWEKKVINRLALYDKYIDYSGTVFVIEPHFPYALIKDMEILKDDIKHTKGDKKALYSDMFNMNILSHFATIDDPTVETEVDNACYAIKEINQHVGEIVFLQSNHDNRVMKFLQRAILQQFQMKQMKYFIKGWKEIFEIKGIKNIHIIEDFILQLGDCLFTHFENNSNVAGAIDRKMVQYLTPRISTPWVLCVQEHTHGQSKLSIDKKTIIEAGYIAKNLDYWVDNGKMHGIGKMSSKGYAKVVFEKGKVLINESNYIQTSWEDPLI